MLSNFLNACRSSIQLKLFLSLTAIVALSLAAILATQVYLVQDYFVRQAEANLRSSNYLLSRVLADPLFAKDLTLLQTRMEDIQSRMPLCNFQLKDNIGTVVYKVGHGQTRVDSEYDPNSRDGCYNTVVPVVHENTLLGTVRMGVRTDDIAKARQNLINDSVFFAMFWFVIFMLPFFAQIRRMVRPLSKLSEAALQFANGNLDFPTPPLVNGNDEISQLTTSFQGMAQSLVRNRDEQAASLAELHKEKLTLDSLLATMPVGVVFADRSNIRYTNAALTRILQLGPEEQLVGMKNDSMLLRLGMIVVDADSFMRDIAEILETRSLTEPKYIMLKDGRTMRLISNTVIAPESSCYLGRFWLFEDATEEKRMLSQAEQRGEQDSLTLLNNRLRYDRDLQRAVAQAERDGSRVALLAFDLDEFKAINDQYGHASGDIVLKDIAQALTAQLRRNEVLYRIGGDEFALLLINASSEEVTILAERILQSVNSLKFDFDGSIVKVSCSLGIARYPQDADSLQTLMWLADTAMYNAKKSGKNQYLFCGDQKAQPETVKHASHTSPYGDMNLGISIIDSQHSALACFIKGILDSLEEGDRSPLLHKRLETLYDLCQIHYQTEEDLMTRHGLPGVERHHEKHRQQLRNLQSLFSELSIDDRQLAKLKIDVQDWLMCHIAGHDKEIADELIRLGET